MLQLTKTLISEGCHVSVINGGKTRDDIIFINDLKTLKNDELLFTTEDGSYCRKGLVIDALHYLLEKNVFDMIYACGSESMINKIFNISEKYSVKLQACMERVIRCSIGLCGSCLIGEYRVCKNGLVLSSEQLREVKDELD